VVLANYALPQFSGLQALAEVQARGLDLPFILVSGTIGQETAVAVLKTGVHDYIMKDRLPRLVPAIARKLREAEGRRARRQMEARIWHLAYYDALTALPNRAGLQDALQQAISAGQHTAASTALLFLELHRFREINQTLGYHNGDALLQQVGQRFQAVLPAAAALDAPFLLGELPLEITASIGIACCPAHGTDATMLMRRADMALGSAAQVGQEYLIYSSAHDRYEPRRLTLMGELRLALEQDQLCLHYQPKVRMDTGQVIGVEALVRWYHPRRSLLQPGQFIPLAEQTGMIKLLSLWVLKAAIQQGQMWQELGLSLAVTVNLSVRNVHDGTLPEQIAAFLETAGAPPGSLGLEITESFIMADPTRALEVLTCLCRMGLHLSIDDFGTGYSSLSYLKQLPVHELKIDKAFVTGLMQVRSGAAIVRTVVDLGHTLGRTVVAGGVEDQQTWYGLLALGGDTAQGYCVSRPVPAANLPHWMDQWHGVAGGTPTS
jgi:predicted signal transduction protein with EAL and GGDEF domain